MLLSWIEPDSLESHTDGSSLSVRLGWPSWTEKRADAAATMINKALRDFYNPSAGRNRLLASGSAYSAATPPYKLGSVYDINCTVLSLCRAVVHALFPPSFQSHFRSGSSSPLPLSAAREERDKSLSALSPIARSWPPRPGRAGEREK